MWFLITGLAGAFVLMSPAGAHVTDSFRHLYREHIKPKLATSGTINRSSNPVHWTKLRGVPRGLADGADATGVRGYEIVQDSESVPSTSNRFLSAVCPPGKRVVGGGVSAIQAGAAHQTGVRVVESYPQDSPGFSAWLGLMANPTGSAVDVQAYAICVNG